MSPLLIIFYLLDPFFKARGERSLENSTRAGACPLVGVYGLFAGSSLSFEMAYNGNVTDEIFTDN
jgi:hypothetical protein